MKAFDFLNVPDNNGITMVMDKGLPPSYIDDYLKVCGEYITFVKFGWGTSAVQDKEIVKEKIKIYKKHNIKAYAGGTLFELCHSKGLYDEYLKECKELGFGCIEISDGSMELSKEDRKNAIRKAKQNGFIVLSEVGKKSIEEDSKLTTEDRINIINEDLRAGSDFVIIEGRESGKSIGLFDEKGNLKDKEFKKILEYIDTNKIIFEAPNKNQQVEFILSIGSDVNLGNIAYEEVISLKTLRTGLRGDTFGKI
ncbi:phosphosulfolactate synthase [Methanococcus aeolicus]|uniref:phosphosulfolactate synthase n=1 Tax=Methanococcus aeolicus TaxID=42879 RepID=UPI0021C64CB4|nr:phosphosulfolactate synthase [Methanococcus aeolicus]UXM84149.1 phosphosulfolactate synthase [Methanococcus aeolicus]